MFNYLKLSRVKSYHQRTSMQAHDVDAKRVTLLVVFLPINLRGSLRKFKILNGSNENQFDPALQPPVDIQPTRNACY